jgi:predicted transposase YbfD/YdcC
MFFPPVVEGICPVEEKKLTKTGGEMSLTKQAIKEEVHHHIKKEIMTEIVKFIEGKRLSLWGTCKGERMFTEEMIYITLYKDIKNVGYDALYHQLAFININDKSLRHNVKEIRKHLEEWGKKHIELDDHYAWNRAIRKVKLGQKIKDANLFIDSADFKFRGKSKISKKSADWSYKANGGGQRYMIVYDGKGLIKRVWGGYSPKLYDGHFLKLMSEYLDKELYGGVVVGDNHFLYGSQYLNHVKFYCNTAENSTKTNRDGKRLSSSTTNEQNFNEQIRAVRGKVESPFGFLKSKFGSLHNFPEDKDQQDAVVTFAMGLFNRSKK